MEKCKWREQNELCDPDHFVETNDMRHSGTARETPVRDFLKTSLDAGQRSGRMMGEMNTNITTVATTTITNTNALLSNLSGAEAALTIGLAALGAYYAGRLTVRAIRFFYGPRAF